MKAVVDTNVVAYFVLGTDHFVAEARGFMAALDEAWAPALWEAELANVDASAPIPPRRIADQIEQRLFEFHSDVEERTTN